MDHSMSSMTNSTCLSSMLFNTYTVDACFLTESWHITNSGMFVASCIGAFLLSVILEAFRRINMKYDLYILRQLAALNAANDLKIPRRATALQQLVRSILWAITLGLAYIIMLLVMSYNVYVLVSVVVGVGVGRFFCDWLVLDGEIGQAKRDECSTVCCG